MQFAKLARIGLVSTLALAMTTEAFAIEARTITDLNVRTGPGKQFSVLGSLYQGEAVDVTECQSAGWCMIFHNGPDGWVSAKYLSQVSDGELPPVVADYPEPEPDYPPLQDDYPPQDYPPQQNYPLPDHSSGEVGDPAAALAFMAILGFGAAAIAGGIGQNNNQPPNHPPQRGNPPNWRDCQPGFHWSVRAPSCLAN